MADELLVGSGDVEPPEQPELPPERSVPLDERREQRESVSAVWTRRIAVATLVLSIFVAGVTAWNAQANLSSNERQASANLAASERQADENFKRDQQRDAYAEFISAIHFSDTSEGYAARSMDRWFYGDESVDPGGLLGYIGPKLDSVFNARDLLAFIAPDDTLAAAQDLVDLVDQLDRAVVRVIDLARDNALQQGDIDEMWDTRDQLHIYDARQAFIELGRRDLAAYDG